ncbi:Initiator Replication protein [Xylophilus ampelinus]|nr:RepB family plasmid replication initiator protein [Variovorax sp.]VTY21352.1 Initiator Replication protein [Xylophilus ampelinus]
MAAKPPPHAASSVPAADAQGRGGRSTPDEVQLLRKAVNTLAIVPKSTRITTLGRKSYNVLLYQAQEQGLEKDVFRTPLDTVVKGLDFDSNDHALIKKHLRAMVSTTVEWQSPTSGEGASWNVSGLLAHAKLSKERGQVWVEWSYAVNLKQELLDPTVFARLRLEVISQLRTHAGVVLYEICTRYKDIGRTARQPWRWWYPVLSGNPPSEKSERLEYRIFKRDTLKPAIAEVNAITDLDIELVEHKQGRFVDEIQFHIGIKKQAALGLRRTAPPVDLSLVARAQALGVPEELLDVLVASHTEAAVRSGLDALERRLANAYPEPLRDPQRYLKALLANERVVLPVQGDADEVAAAPQAAVREQQSARRARWQAEWIRRAGDRAVQAIEALSPEAQRELQDQLLASLQERQAHPSIIKRLTTSGWHHPMVRHEMIRFFADATFGPGWDKPTAEQLLEVAAQLGAEE